MNGRVDSRSSTTFSSSTPLLLERTSPTAAVLASRSFINLVLDGAPVELQPCTEGQRGSRSRVSPWAVRRGPFDCPSTQGRAWFRLHALHLA